MKAYRYGLRPPTVEAELVRQQLRLAWEYRRDLTKACEAYRDVRRGIERSFGLDQELDAIRAADGRAKELGALARQARQNGRSRNAVPAALRAELEAARAGVKTARRAYSDRKSALRDRMTASKKVAQVEWRRTVRELRASYSKRGRGLRFGAYQEVEDSVGRADNTTPLWGGADPERLRWPSWTGEGRIGEQIGDGGLSLGELHGGNSQCVLPVGKYTTLRLRISSNPDRSPVWAEFPAKVHRPIPEGSKIKRAMVQLRREGPREVWTLSLTVDEPAGYRSEPCGEGVVAVDIGWRRYPGRGGLRVAAWHDDQGRSGLVELSSDQVAALRYPEDLRSQRDRNMDAMKKKVCELLRGMGEIPEWLRSTTVRHGDDLPTSAQAVAWLAQWKSPARWVWLAREAAKQGDMLEIAQVLEEWRYHDHHLWAWECGQRGKALRRRQGHYRVTAAWLARTYRTVVVEVFDIRDVAERPPPDQPETEQSERARSWRQLAAVSTLRDAIRNAVISRGGEFIEVDAALTTQECPHEDCQHVEPWDAAAQIERKPPCPACGRTWDQDDGAARVLLRRYRREREGGAENVVDARSGNGSMTCDGTRWQRVRRILAEQKAQADALGK